MESQEFSLSLRSPNLTNISIFDLEDQKDVERTLGSIRTNYGSQLVKEDERSIKIASQDVLCVVELSQERDCSVFLLSVNRLHDDYVSEEWQEDLEYYRRQVHPILDMLPKNPILVLSIFVVPTGSQDGALSLVRQYSEYTDCHQTAAGVVNNHLLATFRTTDSETGFPFLKRELLLSPISPSLPEAKRALSSLLADIKYLAINLARLNRLYQLCRPYFPQLEPGETEIQEKTEGILNRIRQTEPVELETLKSWLSDVMDRFSTLSIMSGLIKRDQITARTYVKDNRSLLNRWGEASLEGYPTNTLMETTEYDSMLQPFEDFIDRTQAIRTQLETVSDATRTYLGIRQQQQNAEMLRQQVKMLHSIEGHERSLKGLTWAVVILTITLVILEVSRALHVLP